MAGNDLHLRVGAIEGGFAADGTEELPDLSKHQSLAAEVLLKRPELYAQMKDRQTKLGIHLARCIKAAVDTPQSTDACLYAGDEDCFEEFAELFDVVIARMHGLLPQGEVKGCRPKRPQNLSPAKPAAKRLDAEIVQSVQLRAARNLRGFRYLPAMDRKERAEVEMLIAKAVRGLAPAVTGVYLPLRQSLSYAPRAGGMDEFEEQRLKAAGLLFGLPDNEPMIASGTCRDWPHGRGIFTSSDRKLAVWINQQEHLTMTVLGQDLHVAYREMQRALDGLGEILRRRQPGENQAFGWTERLGFLTSNLHGLGCSLEAAAILKLPRLGEMEVTHPSSAAGSWRAWAGLMRVKVEPVPVLDGRNVQHCFRICNMDTFNMSEGEVLDAVHEVASQLAIAEHKIQHLSDQDELFPILTSDLSTEEHAKTQSLLSVFSTLVGDERATQAAASHLIKANDENADRSAAKETVAQEEEELNELKDRVKMAMLSKLNDGSLDQAVQTAAQAAGAQHFSDLPPPLPADGHTVESGDNRVDHRIAVLEEVELPHEISQADFEDLNDLRRKTADLLSKAADSGDLARILHKFKDPQEAPRWDLKPSVGTWYMAHIPFTAGASLEDPEEAPRWNLKPSVGTWLLHAPFTDEVLEDIPALEGSPMPNESVEELRFMIRDTLIHSSTDGSLEKILGVKEGVEDLSELRRRTADLLTKAADTGDLAAILTKVKKDANVHLPPGRKVPSPGAEELSELRRRTADLLTKAADTGDLAKILTEVKKEMFVDLRGKVAHLLVEAADTGDLVKILTEVKKDIFGESPGTAEIQALRWDLKPSVGTWLMHVGKEEPLRGSAPSSVHDLRWMLRDTLIHSAEDGSLEKALIERKKGSASAPVHDLRWMLRDTLIHSAEDGSLEKALLARKKGPAPSSVHDLRWMLRDTLLHAAEDGSLEEALQERKKGQELEAIRRIERHLLSALEDGSLEQAIASSKGMAFAPGGAGRAGRAGFELPRETVDELRWTIRDTLLHSLEDGSLEKALGETKRGQEIEALRRIEHYLVSALEDGSLEEALSSSQARAQKEAQQAAKEGTFPKPKAAPLNVEEFSAKMFLEAFSEKGRRMNTLSKMIEEAEVQIRRKEQHCGELQAHISQSKMEIAHLQLDLDWHRSALEGAEERRKELQTTQRKLLGTLHGKMYEISDGPASSTMCPSSPGAAGFQPRPPPPRQ